MNEELEAAVRCITSHNPSAWLSYLTWIGYAHNSHTAFATGLSPFEVSLEYQSTLFPEMEIELAVPSVQHYMQ